MRVCFVFCVADYFNQTKVCTIVRAYSQGSDAGPFHGKSIAQPFDGLYNKYACVCVCALRIENDVDHSTIINDGGDDDNDTEDGGCGCGGGDNINKNNNIKIIKSIFI